MSEHSDKVCESCEVMRGELARICVALGRSKDGTGMDVDWFELYEDVKELAASQKLRSGDSDAVSAEEIEAASKPIKSLAGEAIELTVKFLREIARRSPEVLKHSDIEAFILNELNPAKVMADKDRRSCYGLMGLLAKARTPSASRDQVIEECAKVCDAHDCFFAAQKVRELQDLTPPEGRANIEEPK